MEMLKKNLQIHENIENLTNNLITSRKELKKMLTTRTKNLYDGSLAFSKNSDVNQTCNFIKIEIKLFIKKRVENKN